MSENTVGEIFRQYYHEYCRTHSVSRQQAKVARNIMICRTPQLGGRLRICETCHEIVFQYDSCKDRHCPQCGHFEKERWLLDQGKWVLPIPYYHAVFTISHALNPLVQWNRKRVYDFLMRTVGDLLKEYGKRYLGGEIGVTLVLHTLRQAQGRLWGQTMQFHIHVHCIITGGALVKKDGETRWQSAKRSFLFPVKELSADFRERFCRGLREMWEEGKLVEPEGGSDTSASPSTGSGHRLSAGVAGMFEKAERQAWEVYIERPMCGVEKLLDYLGRYIFRIAIGNHRIVAVEDGHVRFTYQDNRDGGVKKNMRLSAIEFIHRFLQHVLPTGFVRIRHYGLHHSSCRSKLQLVRQLLGLSAALPEIPKLGLSEWLKSVGGEEADPDRCPACGVGRLVTLREFGPTSAWRLILGVWLMKLLFWRLEGAY
jgi:hypothetical protein